MTRVSARAWCRVDLAGGTLDIWPLGVLHQGAVTVNVAIDVPMEVRLDSSERSYRIRSGGEENQVARPEEWLKKPETALFGHLALEFNLPPVDITVTSGSPMGAGLGASSALALAFIAAAEEWLAVPASSPDRRSALARDLESRLMRLPTGRQDHFPALYGGALIIHHRAGGEVVESLTIDLDRFGESLTVAHTGRSHFSAGNNWRVVRARLDQDPSVVARFDEIVEVSHDLARALRDEDFQRVGELMSREWTSRRSLAEGISTPEIEAMLSAAKAAGAWGGKACGAGGGGCVAVLAPPDLRKEIRAALSEHGRVLDAQPASEPLAVTAR